MTLNMWRELASLFSGLAGDDGIRAIVLTQFGSGFLCRGRCLGV